MIIWRKFVIIGKEKRVKRNIIKWQTILEALFAQDEFISMLEGDIIVYEAHVGILKDSLGASKKEDRQIIKSKAFSAKLNALEMEKQEIVKKSNGGFIFHIHYYKIEGNYIFVIFN